MTASHVRVTRGPMPVEYQDALFSWKKYSNYTLISMLCKHTAKWYQMCLCIVQCSQLTLLCHVSNGEHSRLMSPPLLLGLHCCLFRHTGRAMLGLGRCPSLSYSWIQADPVTLSGTSTSNAKRTSTLRGVDVKVLSTVLIHRDGKEQWQEKQTGSEQWMLGTIDEDI